MTKLETLKEQIVDTLGCPRTPDGFCYCEMCQTKYWGKAESILSTIMAKVGKAGLTDEQIKAIEGEVFYQSTHLHNGDGFEFKVQKAVAIAQLQAIKDILDGK